GGHGGRRMSVCASAAVITALAATSAQISRRMIISRILGCPDCASMYCVSALVSGIESVPYSAGGRPPERERPELLAVLNDNEYQPTWATRRRASSLLAVFDCVGSVRTVAFCPSQSRVSSTILPSGNSSAS